MHKSFQVTDSCCRTLRVAHLHIIPHIMLLSLWFLFDLPLPFHPLGVVGIIPFYGQQCTACYYGMPYVVSGDGRMMYHKGTQCLNVGGRGGKESQLLQQCMVELANSLYNRI